MLCWWDELSLKLVCYYHIKSCPDTFFWSRWNYLPGRRATCAPSQAAPPQSPAPPLQLAAQVSSQSGYLLSRSILHSLVAGQVENAPGQVHQRGVEKIDTECWIFGWTERCEGVKESKWEKSPEQSCWCRLRSCLQINNARSNKV